MSGEAPTGAQKRKAYALWFCIALAVDIGFGLFSGAGYRPSLVGLAIMITAALFFAWSWIRER